MLLLACATAVAIAVALSGGGTSPPSHTSTTTEPPRAEDPSALNSAADPVAERLLIEQHDNAQAGTSVDALVQSFSDAQWKIAKALLTEPHTTLVRCEVVRVGALLGLRVRQDAPAIGLKAGDVASVYNNTADLLKEHPDLQLASALQVGQERALIIRKVWWRWHLLMAGR